MKIWLDKFNVNTHTIFRLTKNYVKPSFHNPMSRYDQTTKEYSEQKNKITSIILNFNMQTITKRNQVGPRI